MVDGRYVMTLTQEISHELQHGRATSVGSLVKKALEDGLKPEVILNEGLIDGMKCVGAKFSDNDIFVPEVLVAARAMNCGLDALRPALVRDGIKPVGKAVICTVKGDFHDIGKNIVKMMIESKGIECVDLGTDVDPDTVVRAVIESGAKVVCLSALLRTTMQGQSDVIRALKKAGIRASVKVLIGGAPVTPQFAYDIGADCYTFNATTAADAALAYIKAAERTKKDDK